VGGAAFKGETRKVDTYEQNVYRDFYHTSGILFFGFFSMKEHTKVKVTYMSIWEISQ
jgi:hypothetical protein